MRHLTLSLYLASLSAALVLCAFGSTAKAAPTSSPDPTLQLQRDIDDVLQRLKSVALRVEIPTQPKGPFTCHMPPVRVNVNAPDLRRPTVVSQEDLDRAVIAVLAINTMNEQHLKPVFQPIFDKNRHCAKKERFRCNRC